MRYRRLSYRYRELRSRSGSQALNEFWEGRLLVTFAQPQWRPSTDLFETPKAVIIKAEVAGMAEDDFEITLYDDAIIIEGVRHCDPVGENSRFHAVEVKYGPFRIEVPLIHAIDRDQVTARYDRGFLYITLPKLEG